METTTVTLRWAVVLLVAHPSVQTRMQKEIDAVIGRDRPPTMLDKLSMPYTSAVLMEVQRKANVISFNTPHRTLQETSIAAILSQLTTVLDDPKVFTQPTCFNPDRFLDDDGKSFRRAQVASLVPFGIGKRQCVGESIARMCLFLVVTSLLQRYSLLVPDNGEPPDLTPTYG
uniref:Uncharacterized protein n=1 Tax=Plectus sambesii TaxID=2011161 RepID=A0A914ULT8_9BILA